MVTVRFGGQQLSVLFKFDSVGRIAKDGFEDVIQVRAAIFASDPTYGPRPVALGYAFKSPKDDHDEALAMELALGRALKRLTQDRDVRAQVWKLFHNALNTEKIRAAQQAASQEQFANVLASLEEPNFGLGDPGDEVSSNVLQFDQKTRVTELEERVRKFESEHESDIDLTENCDLCNNLRLELANLRAA